MKFQFLVLFLLFCTSVASRTFVHPGLSHKQSDIDRMRIMVNASVDPWKTSYDQLILESSASYNYSVRGNNSMTVVTQDGTNYSAFASDVQAAYLNSLMWSITGDDRHAQKCVEVFNAWQNLTCFTGGGTESLNAGRVIWKLLEAAEIIKATYNGWTAADIQKFKEMLVYPGYSSTTIPSGLSVSNGTFYWRMYMGDAGRHGNQDLFGWRGIMAMGVFLDNEIMYERALRYLKGEQHRPDDLPYQSGPPIIGNTPVSPNTNQFYIYYGSASGYSNYQVDYGYNGVLEHYIWENGQCQESSRDQDHSILGVGMFASLAEIAWNQGDDMYSMLDNRILKGYEFALKYNISYNYTFEDQLSPWEPTVENGQYIRRRDRSGRWESLKVNPYTENIYQSTVLSRGVGFKTDKRPIYELALAHYRDRIGLTSETYIWTSRANEISINDVGVEKNGWSLDHLGWGGLTARRLASCNGEPVSFNNKLPVYGVHHLISNDGVIEAEDFDYFASHLNGRSYLDLSGIKTANNYRPDSLVTVLPKSEGGFKISDLENGEWLNYTVNIPVSGVYAVKVNCSTSSTGARLKIAFNGIDKSNEVNIPLTGSGLWSDEIISRNVQLSAGLQSMRVFVSGTSNVLEINSIQVLNTMVSSVKSGNWNSPDVWSTGVVPTSESDVVIADNHDITLTESVICNSLTVNGISSIAGTYESGITLTTIGDVTVNGTFSSKFHVIVGGALTIVSGATWNLQSGNNQLLTSNGSVEIAGTLKGNTTAGGSVCSWIIQGDNPTVSVRGTLGGNTIGGLGESVRLFFGHSGIATLTGDGVVNIARLMTASGNTNDQTTIIDANININSTVSSAPALTLQNGSHSTATKVLTINAGKIVKLGNAGSCFHNYSTSAVNNTGGNITYNIHGTLDVSTGRFYLTSNQQTGTQQVNVYVKNGGILKTGSYLNLMQFSTNQKVGIVVEDGGLVDNSNVALTLTSCSNVGASGVKSWITLLTSNALYKQYVAATTTTTLWIGESIISYDAVTVYPAAATTFTVNVHSPVSGTLYNSSLVNDREWNITSSYSTTSSVMLKSGDVSNNLKAVYGMYSGSAWTEATASYDSGSGTFTPASLINFTAATAKTFATGSKSGFVNTLSPLSGDYVSISSGDFGAANTWAVSNGSGGYSSNPATIAPSSSNYFNCWVTSGKTISVSSADAYCKSLTILNGGVVTLGISPSTTKTIYVGSNSYPGDLDIQAGGKLISMTAPAGSVSTIRVYGPNIHVDGQLGAALNNNITAYNASTNPNGGAGLRLFCEYFNSTTNSPTTISGAGTMNIGRLQSGSTNAGQIQSINIDRDINILNTNSNTSAVSLINGNAGTATKTLTINSNRTVSFTGGAISGSGLHYGGTTPNTFANTAGGYTYNINGTLDMGGNSIQLVGPTTSGSTQTIALNIGSAGKVITGSLIRLYKNIATQSITINLATNSTWQIGGSTAPIYENAGNGFTSSWPSIYSNVIVDNSASSGSILLPSSAISASTLTINSDRKLTINAGNQLSAGTLVNNGTLVLKSDAINGTATFIPSNVSAAGTTIAEQYLPDARNWYVSSPVSNALAPSGYSYFKYNEGAANWTASPFIVGDQFTPGVGYIALPSSAGTTLQFIGTLNSGTVDVILSNAGAAKKGFNLIGNPYPSHLIWTKTFVDNNVSLIEPTIWYRTNAGTTNNSGQWSFKTVNASSGEASPLGTSNIIPPMQAFWVRAKTAGTLTMNGDLTQSHQSSNPLKAPTAMNPDRKRLRLEVSNGIMQDETLIFFDASASDDYDSYDSPKMFVNSSATPEIFTSVESENLVINGLNQCSPDTEIPLGFRADLAGQYSLRLIQYENFPEDYRIVLKDKMLNSEHDFQLTNDYLFNSEIINSMDRFSIIFKSGSMISIDDKIEMNKALVRSDSQNRINIYLPDDNHANIQVFNLSGVKLYEVNTVKKINVLPVQLFKGVYLVYVKTKDATFSNKIIIQDK